MVNPNRPRARTRHACVVRDVPGREAAARRPAWLPVRSLAAVLTLLAVWTAPALALQPPPGQGPAQQHAESPSSPGSLDPPGEDPLAAQQWYLDWREGTVSQEDGQGVSVGVMDSGVDATHPEIASSYDAERSRSFLPSDCTPGSECPDLDPAHDPYGHGTEIAGLITADVDGHGIVGAAPGASIVSLKAGDATGRFYAEAVAQALRYAADTGLDVLVLSFTTDPWFRYCPDAPGDTDQERQEQAQDLATITSALEYAAHHGVIMVAAAGNESFDLDQGTADSSSIGWSGQGERPVTDQCVTMPAQSEHVLTVGALDPAGARTFYSNVGSAVDIAAPGGAPVWYDDTDTPHGLESAILTTAPTDVVRSGGTDEEGVSLLPDVVSDCGEGGQRCRYYWYRSGTSFATPLAAAAVAVLLSQGVPAPQAPGLLLDLAAPAACPAPADQDLPCRESPDHPGPTTTWYGRGRLRLPTVPPVGTGDHDEADQTGQPRQH
ncbi:peptidase S8 [Actinomyces sp. 2119]|uniref:S8 family peptidase n=1 Tax=Actinomyces TaxID=1654 RepID=UPI000FF2C37D|nr:MULTISPECIES: S8 family serine peptidase [Actinomyces]RJF41974.1 peptidase S8 [Actinomyces sp. 2119]